MFSKEIIKKLQKVRRKTFNDYDEITLDAEALSVFARLFVNPECQTDIDLFAMKKRKTKLSYLGDHIITAAPSTIAKFAEKRNLTDVREADLLTCFAFDHAHDVHDNKIADKKNAYYALGHILLASRVSSVRDVEGSRAATLTMKTSWGTVTFKNVVVPHDMSVTRGQNVYHHFGVIVAHATDEKLATSIEAIQKKDDFVAQLGRETARKRVVIDFADTAIFQRDVLKQILKPHTVKQVKNPGDLKQKKIRFKN